MSIKFKKWIDNGHFSEDAKHLLDSSIICYKIEAFTASLLMGYLGFLIVLKERLMSADKPDPFPETKWNSIIRNLQNEDKWEETLLTAIMTQEVRNATGIEKASIFAVNDNLRGQIKYWKDRRNDCVHHKDNAIIGAHVETFWSFMQSNLQKITIEGGKNTLINKFRRHYDISYTPANKDLTPLLEEIKGAVEKAELHDFWKKIFYIINNLIDSEEELKVIKTIIRFNDSELLDSLINFLKGHEGLLLSIIEEYPELINYLGYDESEIRKFWSTKLKAMRHNSMGVFAFLLRNDFIPKAEAKDAMDYVGTLLRYTDNVIDHITMETNGFGDVLYNKLFVEHSAEQLKYWDFMNNNCMLYVRYIKFYPLKDEVVAVLCEELAKTIWNPKFLQSALNEHFKKDLNKKKEFIAKASSLGLDLPVPIAELFT